MRSDLFGVVCFVALLVIVIVSNVINHRLKRKIRDNATETTKGRISDVKFCQGDRRCDCFDYWVISYTVGGAHYTLKSGDSGMSRAAMESHLGETVDVYYVPDHPGKAHALVYDVTAWGGAAPF